MNKKTMVVLPALFLLGSLFLCGQVGAMSSTTEMLKQAAIQWKGPLTCDKWDCNCTFNRQRGCCCAAKEMYQIEEDTFIRIKYLWHDISTLYYKVHNYKGDVKIAFKANMEPDAAIAIPDSNERCFGPFNTNVPIPYTSVTLNQGEAYNPSLGAFTAPIAGVYQFSCTVYSYVGRYERIYHKVQLMKNGEATVSVWENNREDGEDSATQVVMLEMKRGDQVYMELVSGRKLCNHLQYNIFTGYIVYPNINE